MNLKQKLNRVNYPQLSRGAAVIWMLVILIGCTLPGPNVPTSLTLNDKLMHVAIFIPFGLLWTLAGLRPGWAVLAGLLFGVTIEIMQAVLPIHRSGDVEDAVADFAGVLIGVGLALGVQRVLKL